MIEIVHADEVRLRVRFEEFGNLGPCFDDLDPVEKRLAHRSPQQFAHLIVRYFNDDVRKLDFTQIALGYAAEAVSGPAILAIIVRRGDASRFSRLNVDQSQMPEIGECALPGAVIEKEDFIGVSDVVSARYEVWVRVDGGDEGLFESPLGRD